MAIAQQDETASPGVTLLNEAKQLLAPLRALKRQLVARLILSELTLFLVTALFCGLLVVVLDASFRWRTPLPRWLGASFVAAALLVSLVVILVRRSWSFTLLGLCERLEELFPALRGQLRSAVSIAQAPMDDPLAGSLRLRSRVLLSAASSLAEIDLSSTVSAQSAKFRSILCLGCLLGLAIWVIAAPSMVWQAARRLAAPWRLDAWPRLVVLELDAPRKIARGGDALVLVQSKTGQLPRKATLYLSDEQGQITTQPMRREEQRFVLSISKVKESFWLRVVGGDDDQMRWRRIEVVEPVSLTATRLEAIPPAYSKAPVLRVGSEMTLLEGTKLVMEFRASRSIKVAKPTWLGQTPSVLSPLTIDSTGRIARGEITLTKSTGGGIANLRVDVRDREDAVVQGAWNGSIRVLRDLPPVIEWHTPKSPAKVQPLSRLSLKASVSDDVGLASLELRRRVMKAEGESTNNDAVWHTEVVTPIADDAKETSFAHGVELGGLELKPGDWLEWMLVALDAKGQAKESEVLRCSVVDVEQLRKETDKRLERFLEQLVDAARRQRETAATLEHVDSSDEARAARLATARAAQFDEHALVDIFSSKAGGLLEVWRRILEEQQSHQLLSPIDRERLEGVTTDLNSLALEELPAVLRELEQVQNSDRATSNASLAPAAALAKKASDHLDEMIDRLAHWRRWSRASQTVDELLGAQQKLQEQTREATPKLLGRRIEELDDEQKRQLESLAEKQAALARQLADLPSPPDSRGESWRSARRLADEEMRLAARDLALNQLSQADSHQDLALGAMRELSKEGAFSGEAAATKEKSEGSSKSAAEASRRGPTEAQVREMIARQSELREKTKKALEALAKPRADKIALEAELATLAETQAKLAKQVEEWQTQGEANQEEKPREEKPSE